MKRRFLFLFAGLLCANPTWAVDYAAWAKNNTDGSWTKATENAVAGSSLGSLVPSDIGTFCPNYGQIADADRQRFWVGLLSAMARPESNFRPETMYAEPNIADAAGENVVSRGLLQISQESANQKAYDCGIKEAEDLHDPAINLTCAVKIMNHWVAKDGVIAAQSKPAVGGARYWSVLRAWRNHLPEITGFTRGLSFCRQAAPADR